VDTRRGESLWDKDQLKDLGTDGTTILKWMLKGNRMEGRQVDSCGSGLRSGGLL
jgi:hypothetical protein